MPNARIVSQLFAALALAAGLAGCSTMPGWTKPSAWYDAVAGDPEAVQKATLEQERQAQKAKANPAGEFPLLSQTPEVPVVSTTPAQRQTIRDGLVSERERLREDAEAAKKVETPESRLRRGP